MHSQIWGTTYELHSLVLEIQCCTLLPGNLLNLEKCIWHLLITSENVNMYLFNKNSDKTYRNVMRKNDTLSIV